MPNKNSQDYYELLTKAHFHSIEEVRQRLSIYQDDLVIKNEDYLSFISMKSKPDATIDSAEWSNLPTWSTLMERVTLVDEAIESDDSTEVSITFHFDKLVDASLDVPPVTQPPSLHWVELLTSADVGPDFVSNLEEIYFERWLPKYGARTAHSIMIVQGIRFIASQWIEPIFKLIDRLNPFSLGKTS